MNTRHCDECVHGNSHRPAAIVCDKGHKPKWYMPKSGIDTDWGYKRKCDDFREKTPNVELRGEEQAQLATNPSRTKGSTSGDANG